LQTFDSLLSIAEIEAASRRSRFTNIDLSSIAEGLVDSYRAVAEENMQTLIGNVHQGLDVRGDGGLLTQLLVNLVENAIQHSG
jgi:signal transduction histidine kinase